MRELGPKGAETHRKIIDTAITLFAQKGYIRTSMEEIAANVGITKPAIYSYFVSKQEILETILIRLGEGINDIKEQFKPANSLKERLYEINTVMFQYLNSKDLNILWMLATVTSGEIYEQVPSDRLSQVTKIINQLITIFIDIFQEEKDLGRIKPDVNPRYAALHFLAVLVLYLLQKRIWITVIEEDELKQMANSFLDSFLYGIAAE